MTTEPLYMAIFLFVVLLLLILTGIPIAFSLFITGTLGLFLAGGVRTFDVVPLKMAKVLTEFGLLAVPVFVLLGALLESSGLDTPLYKALSKWLNWLPGGTGVATIVGLAWFGAICGSTVATAASLAKVAIPQLLKEGYDKAISTGLLSGGSIGSLIPPSLITIVYAIYSETSIGKIWIAQVVPAIILVATFCLFVIIMGIFKPKLVPRPKLEVSWLQRTKAIPDLLPILVIMVFITGSIYTGVATPTEAGAVAVIAMVIVIAIIGGFSRLRCAFPAARETLHITGFIILIIAGAQVFAMSFAFHGIPEAASSIVGRIANPQLILMVMMLIYIILGAFMDTVGMMMLTLPIFLPILRAINFPLEVFGVMIAVQCEIAVLTPPVGNTLYLIAGIAEPYGVTLKDTMIGIIPYVIMDTGLLFLLIFFPEIALWLPQRMM